MKQAEKKRRRRILYRIAGRGQTVDQVAQELGEPLDYVRLVWIQEQTQATRLLRSERVEAMREAQRIADGKRRSKRASLIADIVVTRADADPEQ